MIRFLEAGDAKNLKKFYDEAYGSKHILHSPIHQDWQFKKNPFNTFNRVTIVLDENENEITSHCGLIPVELKVLNSTRSALWHVSFFTLERYRGQGLGTKLIQYSNNLCDFSMVLNGSDGTKKIYVNTGGKDLGNLNRYVGLLDKNRVEEFSRITIPKNQLNFVSNLNPDFKRVFNLDQKYEKFWEKVKEKFPITVNRTMEYLDWRYLKHPLLDYHFMILEKNNELVGFTVLRFEDKNEVLKAIRIVDLVVLSGYEREFLQHMVNYCKGKGHFMDFFCSGKFYRDDFEREGFFNNTDLNLPIPSVFNPIDVNRRSHINFFYNAVDKDVPNKEILDDVNNWYFVKADSDQDRAN
ncbi:GNAT family N-acetyltransferase [Candidatus Nitrosotenuis chungbukensis]|uniref:GNAT family N-acetyltransferase n=1 Tax=Candidatus Nitrosotenuis chungbukensis TaxID=1353246 RepID=UPI0012FEBE18|nr:GNAT family N-acetyltransferase [Candidatus Nitrosotenuis chungbukensis]